MPLAAIRSLVKEDLAATDEFIISQLESNIPMVREVIEYVLSCGGKRVRPLVLALGAKALNPEATDHIRLAAVIELIHTATLLHDDVVDNSTLRRGNQTANIIWGNDASILIGDFLYSRAFQIVVELKQQAILEIFAKATHYIAEGEIMQMVNAKNPDTAEAFYYEIIQRKTAKLFEIATQLGAMMASHDEQQIDALREYGLHLGLAYQLIDDAIDYSQTTDEAGKNVGQDLDEGKCTLPLIYAMSQSQGEDLQLLRSSIKAGSSENLAAILKILEATKAIEYTANVAKQHAEKAIAALAIVPDSVYKKALIDLSDFVVNRTY